MLDAQSFISCIRREAAAEYHTGSSTKELDMAVQSSSPRVAVVLAGSGRGDGSEIHESVSCLIHLARLGASYQCFAPDLPQADVINHLTGEPMAEKRNMLVEAARIARGDIKPIGELREGEFDAVVFPGGFGAAKNLCTFAKDGAKATVNADVERVIKGFHGAKKPVAMCCIAPVLGARVLGKAAGGPGVKVTIGDDANVAGAISTWGSSNIVKKVTEAAVDEANRLTTTPAYMYGDASPWEVYQGIGAMIEQMVGMLRAAGKKAAMQHA
jgi:enhancing lycopene biosynthesis protein 2